MDTGIEVPGPDLTLPSWTFGVVVAVVVLGILGWGADTTLRHREWVRPAEGGWSRRATGMARLVLGGMLAVFGALDALLPTWVPSVYPFLVVVAAAVALLVALNRSDKAHARRLPRPSPPAEGNPAALPGEPRYDNPDDVYRRTGPEHTRR